MQAHINILGMRKGIETQVEYHRFFNYKRPPFPIMWKATLLRPTLPAGGKNNLKWWIAHKSKFFKATGIWWDRKKFPGQNLNREGTPEM